jgi:hypothetical protein
MRNNSSSPELCTKQDAPARCRCSSSLALRSAHVVCPFSFRRPPCGPKIRPRRRCRCQRRLCLHDLLKSVINCFFKREVTESLSLYERIVSSVAALRIKVVIVLALRMKRVVIVAVLRMKRVVIVLYYESNDSQTLTVVTLSYINRVFLHKS